MRWLERVDMSGCGFGAEVEAVDAVAGWLARRRWGKAGRSVLEVGLEGNPGLVQGLDMTKSAERLREVARQAGVVLRMPKDDDEEEGENGARGRGEESGYGR